MLFRQAVQLARTMRYGLLCMAVCCSLFAGNSANAAISAKDQAIVDASEIFVFDEGHSVFINAAAADAIATANGNEGANLGEQRLLAFKYALGMLATELRITQPIHVGITTKSFDDCAFYASATYNYSWLSDDLPLKNTLYPTSLAEQLLGRNLSGDEVDIVITFSQPNLDGKCGGFYLGFAPLPSIGGSYVDFIRLVTHEMIHGLGFEKRPNGSEVAFIFERMLWARDEQTIYANLSEANRDGAARKTENVVFNGRYTRQHALQSFDEKVVVATLNPEQKLPAITSDVVNSLSVDGIIMGQVVLFDSNTCKTETSIAGKIALFPSGCAREELGYSGARAGVLKQAQAQGALAAITSSPIFTRRPAFVDLTIPVLTLPFEDYEKLAAFAAANNNEVFVIRKEFNLPAGADSFGRPIMFTGPGLADLSRLLHFSPRVHPKPLDHHTRRNLMEPIITFSVHEPVERTIQEVLPSLLDLGWAVRSCGNGQLEPHEECDDGDTKGGMLCTQNCMLPGYCGDGVVDLMTEQCDSGTNNSDTKAGGCSSICTVNM